MSPLLSRLVAGLAVAAGAAVLVAPRPVAVAGGLLLAFVLPGYALLPVLFRRRALTTVERAVLAPALSMGVLIAAGLFLSVAGLRLDRPAWTLATAGVTLAALLAARFRPERRTAVAAPAPVLHGDAAGDTVLMTIAPVQAPPRRRLPLRQVLPLLVVAAVLGGASWLSFATSRDVHDPVVTTLSAAPPGPVDAAGNRSVQLSAGGLLAADGPYTVSVTGPAGTATVRRTVAVTGDGTWTTRLSLPAAQRLTVSLYRSGDTTAYRTLYLSAVD